MSSSTPANALQGHRQRPSTSRPIVPAIPLPYIQKRKQNSVAPKKLDVEPVATLSPATPASSSPAPATDITSTISAPAISNGSPETIVDKESVAENAPTVDTATAVKKGLEEGVHTALELPSEDSGEGENKIHKSLPVASSDQQSTESRSTYNMPPPFVPASHGQSNTFITEAVKFSGQPSIGGQNPNHQAHPSIGSLVFGGYPESNNSSPAPPPSGGAGQFAPQHQHEGGRVQAPPYSNGVHMHTFSNGYSPMGPPAPAGYYARHDNFVNQNPAMENFTRRQMGVPGPHDGYSPSGTPLGVESQRFPLTFDPSTPHSFHGSQSSAADANGQQFYSQYPPAVNSNGSNGHIEDVRLYHQPGPKGRTGSQPLALNQGPNMSQPLMPQNMDNLDGLLMYLQSQFADPQFADYTLELRYSDDRAPPVRIPGHNLLFARSPALKSLMTAQARDSTSDGIALRTLLIESDDRFLRSDGFSMAVHRLYGGSLLDPGASVNIPAMLQSSAVPGTPADRFELALGYAAAGIILQMPPVVNRGVDIAGHFVGWATLETALDFSLDGGLDSQWTLENTQNSISPSTYGPAVNGLIHRVLNFIITSFPPNFELDVSAKEPIHNHRLPLVLENRPTSANPRLSSIKFGDHHSEDSYRDGSNTTIQAILSRILLNIPFHLLKYVLESSRLGNVQGWATAELRKKAMLSVVEERENRRIRVRENRSVLNYQRSANSKEWNAVGWEESLVPVQGNPETSALHRTWVDFVLQEGSGN